MVVFSSSPSMAETRSCGGHPTFWSSTMMAGLPPCAQGLVGWGWDLMRWRNEMGHQLRYAPVDRRNPGSSWNYIS
jgi:hypothetical protein